MWLLGAQVLDQAINWGQFGIAGVILLMLFFERKDKRTVEKDKAALMELTKDCLTALKDSNETKKTLISVITANTEAMTALKEKVNK